MRKPDLVFLVLVLAYFGLGFLLKGSAPVTETDRRPLLLFVPHLLIAAALISASIFLPQPHRRQPALCEPPFPLADLVKAVAPEYNAALARRDYAGAAEALEKAVEKALAAQPALGVSLADCAPGLYDGLIVYGY